MKTLTAMLTQIVNHLLPPPKADNAPLEASLPEAEAVASEPEAVGATPMVLEPLTVTTWGASEETESVEVVCAVLALLVLVEATELDDEVVVETDVLEVLLPAARRDEASTIVVDWAASLLATELARSANPTAAGLYLNTV